MNVVIIGAGPAGLTAAYALAKRGVTVSVLEATGAVGGMARTIPLWGQRVDLGPHRFFSADPRVNKLWLEIAGADYDMVSRLTRILYKNRLFHYPLKPANALRNLGPLEAARCLASYLLQQFRQTPAADADIADASFEQWVTRRFGRRLYEIFFKTYSEKLWGIPGDRLDADFAAQRIKKFSLGVALKTALLGAGGQHQTLVDLFAYPRGGSGAIYEQMAARISASGGRLRLNTPARRVLTRAGRATAVELVTGETVSADHIISTMPLTDLVARLEPAPVPVLSACARLKYRNTILVFLQLDADRLFPDNWLYVHAADLRCGRITNFRNWSPTLTGAERATILALEYWCNDADAFWRLPDAALTALATDEIKRSGLLPRGLAITAGHVERLHRSYPVYERGYKQPLTVVANYLKTIPGLTLIGRYGAFKYNNQDHSILMGLLAADNLAAAADGAPPPHDLWSVNTDYEYQEASVITATGLQPRRR
ncbi:MAG: FAD-dependent oxidoreductase [Verrucomicrobiales bacterium]|nr:FAD-dependent oxidoreductase [Verrucomicrobiales bacterium]